MTASHGACIDSATEKLAMDHTLLVWLGDAPDAVTTNTFLLFFFHTKTFHR